MLAFGIISKDGSQRRLEFEPRRVLNAAYAGRTAEDVRRHMADVHGAEAADAETFPYLAPVTAHNLVSDVSIQETSAYMIGEVEYVLVAHDGEIFVGVGSDHCDIALEEHDFTHSKNVAPNLVGRCLWPLDDVLEHFDELRLACRVRRNGAWLLTQDAPAATLRHPLFWLDHPALRDVWADGTVLFSGTINHVDGMVQGDAYDVMIEDPVMGRSLRHSYDCLRVEAPAVLRPAAHALD